MFITKQMTNVSREVTSTILSMSLLTVMAGAARLLSHAPAQIPSFSHAFALGSTLHGSVHFACRGHPTLTRIIRRRPHGDL